MRRMSAKASRKREKAVAAGPKWNRRAEARPEEILEAALAVFNEKGFEAARMEDVAKRAGLSKAGVYLYFESKEALLKALIEGRLAPLAQMARAAAEAATADPVAALRQMGALAAAKLGDPRNFAIPRLVLSVAPRFPEIAEFHRRHVVEIIRGAVEHVIAAGIAKGDFRKVDPRAASRAIMGPVLLEAMWTHVLRGESAFADPKAFIDAHFDLVLNGLSESRS